MQQLFTVRNGAPKPWDEGLPPADEELSFEVGGLSSWGKTGDTLFVHGWEGRFTQFTPIMRQLITAGRGVAAIEMPGHGRFADQKSNPLEFSKAIQRAVDHVGSFTMIIAHSQGGTGVLHAMSKGVSAERIALLAPLASVEAHLRQVCGLVKLSDEGTDLLLKKVEATVGVPPSEFDAYELSKLRSEPTLVIHDKADKEVPFEPTEKFVKNWTNAKLIETSGLGHRRILNDPSTIENVFNFLTAPNA